MADEDLDICEIIALMILTGAPFDPRQPLTGLNELMLRFLTAQTACFTQMSRRAQREYEVWWVLYLAGCVTDDEMRRIIGQIKVQTTDDQRKAMLTGLRSTVWDYATCGDLP